MTLFNIKFFQEHASGFSIDINGTKAEEAPSSKRAHHS